MPVAMNEGAFPGQIDAEALALILRLRLLVCRAAQPDSLKWWDDNALTAEGAYLTERLFSRRPRAAAARIALAAARSRHWAAYFEAAGHPSYRPGRTASPARCCPYLQKITVGMPVMCVAPIHRASAESSNQETWSVSAGLRGWRTNSAPSRWSRNAFSPN